MSSKDNSEFDEISYPDNDTVNIVQENYPLVTWTEVAHPSRSQISTMYFTTNEWTSQNPILPMGTIGIEIDTNRIKVGNGELPWSELDYMYIDMDFNEEATTEPLTENQLNDIRSYVDTFLEDQINTIYENLAESALTNEDIDNDDETDFAQEMNMAADLPRNISISHATALGSLEQIRVWMDHAFPEIMNSVDNEHRQHILDTTLFEGKLIDSSNYKNFINLEVCDNFRMISELTEDILVYEHERRDVPTIITTSSQWVDCDARNIIFLAGSFLYAHDSQVLKESDGITKFKDLPELDSPMFNIFKERLSLYVKRLQISKTKDKTKTHKSSIANHIEDYINRSIK